MLPKGADKLIAELDGKAKNVDHMGDTETETLHLHRNSNSRVINQNSKLFYDLVCIHLSHKLIEFGVVEAATNAGGKRQLIST